MIKALKTLTMESDSMKLVYRIEGMYDRLGNEIKNERRQARRYYIESMLIGSTAKLVNVDDAIMVVETSTIEDIFIHRNVVKLVTKNTEYLLVPSIEVVE